MIGKGGRQPRVCCGRPRLQGVGSASSADLIVSPFSSARKVELGRGRSVSCKPGTCGQKSHSRALVAGFAVADQGKCLVSVYMLPGGDATLWGTTL